MKMAFVNITLNPENLTSAVITETCCKGLDEYSSDEELAHDHVFSDYPDALLQFAAACTFIFMIIGIPGNIVTIIALSRYRKVRNATAIFIINLSVSDLLFAVTMFPITITLFLQKSWTTGRIICRIFPALNYSLTASSVFTIVAITINRYVMVAHPLYYPRLYQTKNLIIMISAIWIGAFAVVIPTLFEIWGRFSLDPLVGFCTIVPDKNHHSPKTPIIIMGFVFPCFFIVACYGRIMYIVKKSSARSTYRPPLPSTSNIERDSNSRNPEVSARELSSSQTTEEDETGDKTETNSGNLLKVFQKNLRTTFKRRPRRLSTAPTRRDKRLQAMIIAILISFFTCHLPIMIVKAAYREFAVGHYGNIMGYILIYMTTCSNPIIYVVMSREYRKAYKSVFGFLCKDKIPCIKISNKLRIPSKRTSNDVVQGSNAPL